MRTLGEQWVENDRMYKAVKGVCENCGISHLCTLSASCPMVWGLIAKDLGPVNEDGCLAEERTGLFPTITKVTDGIWKASVYQNGGLMQIEIVVWATTQQQVIYAWNRREYERTRNSQEISSRQRL